MVRVLLNDLERPTLAWPSCDATRRLSDMVFSPIIDIARHRNARAAFRRTWMEGTHLTSLYLYRTIVETFKGAQEGAVTLSSN
jgi:hypothetical protein